MKWAIAVMIAVEDVGVHAKFVLPPSVIRYTCRDEYYPSFERSLKARPTKIMTVPTASIPRIPAAICATGDQLKKGN